MLLQCTPNNDTYHVELDIHRSSAWVSVEIAPGGTLVMLYPFTWHVHNINALAIGDDYV